MTDIYSQVVPREIQKYVLDNLDTSKRVILIEAPTGSGKSYLGAAVHFVFKSRRTVIFTATKQLQEQYLDASGFYGLGMHVGSREKVLTNLLPLEDLLDKKIKDSEIQVLNYKLTASLSKSPADVVVIDEADEIKDLSSLIPYANVLVVMSATILNSELFLADKNLSAFMDNYSFISVNDLYIKPEIRPIVYQPKAHVSLSNPNLDKLLPAVLELCTKLNNWRGIVHSVNMYLTEEIGKYLTANLPQDLSVD